MKYQIITAYVGGQYATVAYECDSQTELHTQLEFLRGQNGNPHRHYWVLNN